MDADKIPHVESDESFEQSHRRVSEWRARTLSDAAEIHGGSRRQERVRFAIVEPLLRSLTPSTGARALDLGCGVGTYTPLLREVGYEVIGVDFSVPSLVRGAPCRGRALCRRGGVPAALLPRRRSTSCSVSASSTW